jgi:hypothetical protein
VIATDALRGATLDQLIAAGRVRVAVDHGLDGTDLPEAGDES